jgi:hypothetical protein
MNAKSKIPKAPPTTMPAMAPLDNPIQIGIITMSASYMAIYNYFHTMILSHITLSLFYIYILTSMKLQCCVQCSIHLICKRVEKTSIDVEVRHLIEEKYFEYQFFF